MTTVEYLKLVHRQIPSILSGWIPVAECALSGHLPSSLGGAFRSSCVRMICSVSYVTSRSNYHSTSARALTSAVGEHALVGSLDLRWPSPSQAHKPGTQRPGEVSAGSSGYANPVAQVRAGSHESRFIRSLGYKR